MENRDHDILIKLDTKLDMLLQWRAEHSQRHSRLEIGFVLLVLGSMMTFWYL